jgi:hypothetical protein
MVWVCSSASSPSGAGFEEIFLQQSSSYLWIGRVPVADQYWHPQLSLVYLGIVWVVPSGVEVIPQSRVVLQRFG